AWVRARAVAHRVVRAQALVPELRRIAEVRVRGPLGGVARLISGAVRRLSPRVGARPREERTTVRRVGNSEEAQRERCGLALDLSHRDRERLAVIEVGRAMDLAPRPVVLLIEVDVLFAIAASGALPLC